MTHQELNMVLHLIDTYTQEKENGYCGMYGYSRYMDENNIRRVNYLTTKVVGLQKALVVYSKS